MGIVAWARRRLGGDPERRYGPAFDALAAGRGIGGIASAAGVAVNEKSALTLAAYFAAINVLSTDLACLPIELFRRRKSGGRDKVTDDVRSDRLGVSPDGETTSMRFRQALYGHAIGQGNGHAEIGFSGGTFEGLYLIEPGTTTERRSQDRRLYYRLPDGSTRPPYKILHVAGFGCDGLNGYSVARLMRDAIGLGKAAEVFGAAFFGNGTQSSGFFEFPATMKPDAIANWRKEVNAFHQSATNAFKFMILEGGMKFTPSTVPPEDIQFLSVRQFQVLEIARAFRLPPHKLGDYSQSHLANIEESNIDYMTTTLMPWCESIEQELNRKLLTEDERRRGFYFEHKMNAFLRGNMGARASFYQSMFGLGVYSRNRIAELENENPVGPEGDELFVTVQAQPLRALLNPPGPEAPPKAAADGAVGAETLPFPGAANRVARHLAEVSANGHAATNGHAPARFNPNHGADGKFASHGGASPLAAHAPATTPTGSAIEVLEGPPKSRADEAFVEKASAAGKEAFRLTDTPKVDVERGESSTDYRVGGEIAKRVEKVDGPDPAAGPADRWRVLGYSDKGEPLPAAYTGYHKTREGAERIAEKDARAIQKQDTLSTRVATKDPAGLVSAGQSAHAHYYDPRRGGEGPDRTNANWTTTYYHMKAGGEEKGARRPALRFNPNHGADGKFASTSGLAAHAPATTTTGAKLVVEEGPPTTPADRKHAAAAEARGKTAIKLVDSPNVKELRNEESTRTYVGGVINGKVEPTGGKDQYGGDWKGWKATYYDRDGKATMSEDHDTRKGAERATTTFAKTVRREESRQARVSVKDPEEFVAKGESASLHYSGGTVDRTDHHWTTTYRVFTNPGGDGDGERFNPYHGKDGKFTSKGGHGIAVGGKVPPKKGGGKDDGKAPGGGKPKDEPAETPAKPAPEPTKPPPAKPAAPAKPEPTPEPPPKPVPVAPPKAGPLAKDLADASPKDVTAYHDSMSADAVAGMSVKEKGAVQGYSSSLYQQVNDLHRKGAVAEGFKKGDLDSLSRSLDSAIDKGALKEPIKVYRGVGNAAALGITPGAVIQDKGYLSTSLTPKVAAAFGKQKGGAVLEITAPKGSRAISVAGMTNRKGENEVLFARNSQMKITGMRVEKGRTIYTAEMQ